MVQIRSSELQPSVQIAVTRREAELMIRAMDFAYRKAATGTAEELKAVLDQFVLAYSNANDKFSEQRRHNAKTYRQRKKQRESAPGEKGEEV